MHAEHVPVPIAVGPACSDMSCLWLFPAYEIVVKHKQTSRTMCR